MKKYLLIAAFGLFGLAVARAGEMISQPSADTRQPAFPEYGGVRVSTYSGANGAVLPSINFGTATVTGPGVFYGVMFSTASIYPNPDYVDVYDSTSANQRVGTQIARIYNSNYNQSGSTISAGFSGPPLPIRFFDGLIYRPSVNTQPVLGILYYPEKD
jgi:hypothetical protein